MVGLEEVCGQLRESYVQLQDNNRALVEENRHLVGAFEEERLRLEKSHLSEVARLHKAVKSMTKKAKAMKKQQYAPVAK